MAFITHQQLLRNAKEDFDLNPIEENMIARHMFPLTPIPPRYKEAWILCLADKYCATVETLLPLLMWKVLRARMIKSFISELRQTQMYTVDPSSFQ